jgi:hypothetical protein
VSRTDGRCRRRNDEIVNRSFEDRFVHCSFVTFECAPWDEMSLGLLLRVAERQQRPPNRGNNSRAIPSGRRDCVVIKCVLPASSTATTLVASEPPTAHPRSRLRPATSRTVCIATTEATEASASKSKASIVTTPTEATGESVSKSKASIVTALTEATITAIPHFMVCRQQKWEPSMTL